jgi:hypothetical protein
LGKANIPKLSVTFEDIELQIIYKHYLFNVFSEEEKVTLKDLDREYWSGKIPNGG